MVKKSHHSRLNRSCKLEGKYWLERETFLSFGYNIHIVKSVIQFSANFHLVVLIKGKKEILVSLMNASERLLETPNKTSITKWFSLVAELSKESLVSVPYGCINWYSNQTSLLLWIPASKANNSKKQNQTKLNQTKHKNVSRSEITKPTWLPHRYDWTCSFSCLLDSLHFWFSFGTKSLVSLNLTVCVLEYCYNYLEICDYGL